MAAKALNLPLRVYLGGSAQTKVMPLSFTVTAHDAKEATDEVAAARSRGFAHFNFKAAVDEATDTAVAKAVREAAGPHAFVWADANQGYALHAARRAAAAFADAGVDVLEQPLPADRINLMRQLRHNSTLALAVDEATVSPADFFAYASEGLVDYLVVKVTRSGGLCPSLQQIAIAEAAGLGLLVSGLTDGLLTKLAALQLAAALDYRGPAALNGSQFTDESALFPEKTHIEKDGCVHLPNRPGVGVEPDAEAINRFECEQ
jgi:muconate cycloisomerase